MRTAPSQSRIELSRIRCRACTHSLPDRKDWALFRQMMLDAGATVPEHAAPRWLTVPIEKAALE